MTEKSLGALQPEGLTRTVTAAGTREVLLAHQTADPICIGAVIQALSTNGGKIYLGGSNVSSSVYGVALDAKDAINLELSDYEVKMGIRIDLSKFYIDAGTSGEGVSILIMRE